MTPPVLALATLGTVQDHLLHIKAEVNLGKLLSQGYAWNRKQTQIRVKCKKHQQKNPQKFQLWTGCLLRLERISSVEGHFLHKPNKTPNFLKNLTDKGIAQGFRLHWIVVEEIHLETKQFPSKNRLAAWSAWPVIPIHSVNRTFDSLCITPKFLLPKTCLPNSRSDPKPEKCDVFLSCLWLSGLPLS